MIIYYLIIIIITMKNTKIPCSNVSTESYTGKEQSPKRFGLSAEGFDINFEKEGFDNQIWSVQLKNNRKVWVRKTNIVKITHEEPLINSTIPTLTSQSIDPAIINNDDVIEIHSNDDKIIDTINISDKPEKKKTDYNIFIKYYLDKLKSENKDKTPHKILFQITTQEWARLKKFPDELKILMNNIKK
jgi:hypothetical protein